MASNYTTGYNDPEGTHGPHSSRVANAVDPRVDSDRDHRGAPGAAAPGVGSTGYGTSTTTAGTGTGFAGAHGTHTTDTSTAGVTARENTGERAARGIKGVFAQGHGIGESLRGNINSAIDSLTGDKAKQAHDEEVARGGFREVANKEFEKKGTTDKAL